MSPQFAIPYEAHTTNPAGEPFHHWSIATPQYINDTMKSM
jgi:hypothetical protein